MRLVPNINLEAERYARVFDKVSSPPEFDRKLFGMIGRFSIVGSLIFPPFLGDVIYKIRRHRIDRAGVRYVRAITANFPNDAGLHDGTTLESLRRHAEFFAPNQTNNNQEGNN